MRLIDADQLSEELSCFLNEILIDRDMSDSECKKENFNSMIYAVGECMSLINISPTADQWTPVSMGLPTKRGKYWVTDLNDDVVVYLYNPKGNSEEYWKRCVKAWRPFPTPYRKEGVESNV